MEILFLFAVVSMFMLLLYYVIVKAVRKGMIQAYYYIEASNLSDLKRDDD